MAMVAGDTTVAPGTMSGAIYVAMIANAAQMGLFLTDQTALKALCAALGQGIVPYIQATATVTAVGPDPQGGVVASAGTVA